MKKIFQIIMILSIAVATFNSCTENKNDIPVRSVTIKASTTLTLGASEQLQVTIVPGNATNKYIFWRSENSSIATVDNDGLVRAISVGLTVVRVSTGNGECISNCAVLVQNPTIPVASVSLNKTATTISVNGSEELACSIFPPEASNRNVRWSSNNVSVATVDNNGKVVGVAAGKAIITVATEDGPFIANCEVTVQVAPIPVNGVGLNKSNTTVSIGGAEQLYATIDPANATNKNVKWSSDDTGIAQVNENGVVTGVAAGTAIITVASDENEGFATSCVVTVQDATIRVSGVGLNKSNTTVSIGDTEQLYATIDPANATNKNVTWSSSDTGIAKVDENGVVTGVAVGTAIITVASDENNGFATNCVVTVQDPITHVTGVTLNKTALAIYIDDVEKLTATISPPNATNKSVSWSSDNTDVATVDNDGVVTGVSAGTATITAKSDNDDIETHCTVTVADEMGNVASTGWSAPSPNSYEYSMTYVAQVAFRGSLSADANVEIAAFVDNDLRGFARLVHDSKMNVYLVHLTIYSNSAGGETVVLKAYNPLKKRIYENCKTLTFQGDTSLGSLTEILNCFP